MGAYDQAVLLTYLQQVPTFGAWTEPELEHLLGLADMRAVEAGTDVVREGEVGDEFFLVAQGEVEVQRRGPPGGAASVPAASSASSRCSTTRPGTRRSSPSPLRPSRCSTAPISTRHSATSRRSAIHSSAAWPDGSTSRTIRVRSANVCSTSARAVGSLDLMPSPGTTAAKRLPDDTIVVRGAREHNLRTSTSCCPATS